MDLLLDMTLAARLKSGAQRARVLSEDWAARNLFCPNCSSNRLTQLPNNARAADFACPRCEDQFELKSGVRIGPKIANGAYHSLIKRLEAADNPNLVLLRFNETKTTVRSLEIIPRQFFIPALVMERPPLTPSARRAGWIGSTIRLDLIPMAGRISVVLDGVIRIPDQVRAAWSHTSFLRAEHPDGSWMVVMMKLVDHFGGRAFSLAEIYAFEAELTATFPGNHNVRPKIRQLLQKLRDAGLLHFLGAGRYQSRAISTADMPPGEGSNRRDPDAG